MKNTPKNFLLLLTTQKNMTLILIKYKINIAQVRLFNVPK